MDKLIEFPLSTIKNFTKSLRKKNLLVEKPWALVDDDGKIQKLIFKSDKGLILSKNGKVTEGSWDYFPEAKSLLIDRVTDKLLLNEEFIDDNVLILKKDGTDNEYFALANENVIPDYNIPKYLNTLKCEREDIKERNLLDGSVIQIWEATNAAMNTKIEIRDKDYNYFEAGDGKYITEDKKFTYSTKNGRYNGKTTNFLLKTSDGRIYEIEDGMEDVASNKGKTITINGSSIEGYKRIVDSVGIVYFITESIISNIHYLGDYELSDGYKVKIEHIKGHKFSKGDKIVHSEPVSPLPDGRYKVKGTLWKKIQIVDSQIV